MIDWLVPHQANKRIIEATAERMRLPTERVMVTIHKYGNTTAATIPLCLWDYEEKLKAGDRLLLAAFGGGFTWAGIYLTWAYDGASGSKSSRQTANGASTDRLTLSDGANRRSDRPRALAEEMSKHRVAIVGLGMALKPHLQSLEELADRVEIAACFTPSAERRKAFAAANTHPVVDTLDAILADRSIDIVLMLTPPMTHLELVETLRRRPASTCCWKSRSTSPASARARRSTAWSKAGPQVRHHAAASLPRCLAQAARQRRRPANSARWCRPRPRSAGGARRNISRNPGAA